MMGWFSKKKKPSEIDTSTHQDDPFIAHMERKGPRDSRQRLIIGKLDTLEELHSEADMYEETKERWGGGDYRAILYQQSDRRHGYIGVRHFTIPGEPKVDGKIVPLEEKRAKGDKKEGKVAELEAKRAELKAQRDLDREKAEFEKEKAEWEAGGGKKSNELAALQAQIETMQAAFEQREQEHAQELADRDERDREKEERAERKREREEHANDMKQLREDSDRKFEALLAEIKDGKSQSAEASNLQVLSQSMRESAKVQMEGMKQIVESMRDQVKAMLNTMSQPSAAATEAAETRKEMMAMMRAQLAQSKGDKFGEIIQIMEFVKDFAASQSAEPGDPWAQTAENIAKSLGAAIMSVADQRRKALAAPAAPAVDTKQIEGQARAGARDEIRKSREAARAKLKALKQAEEAERTEAPAAPATEVAPGIEPAPDPEPIPVVELPPMPTDPDQLEHRKGLVADLLTLIKTEMKEQPNAPTWPELAHRHLPKDMLDVVRAVNSEESYLKAIDMFRQYDDKGVVDEMMEMSEGNPALTMWFAAGFGQLGQME